MPIFRYDSDGYNNSGTPEWKSISNIYRLTGSTWQKIRKIYRFNSLISAKWALIFEGTDAPQPKATVARTYVGATTYGILNSQTVFYSGDTIRTTRGDWTQNPTSIRIRIQSSNNPGGGYSTAGTADKTYNSSSTPTLANTTTNTYIEYTITKEDALNNSYYFRGLIQATNADGTTPLETPAIQSRLGFAITSFTASSETPSGARFDWAIAGMPNDNIYVHSQKLTIRKRSDNVVVKTVDVAAGASFVIVNDSTALTSSTGYYAKLEITAYDSYFSTENPTVQIYDLLSFDTSTPISITFNANGGTLSSGPGNGLTSYTYTQGISQTFVAPDATRTHYTLGITSGSTADWRYPQSGGDPFYLTAGSTYTYGDSGNGLNSDKTFWAQWTGNTYTVTYNANGGSVSPASDPVVYPNSITLATPTRQGYTFDGWYTALTGGTLVSSPYTPTANITLYARWSQITYTITWNANGGSPSLSSTGTDGSTVTAPTQGSGTFQMDRTGYDLFYFRDTPSADYLYSINPGGSWTIDNRSRTFYARWALKTYTVSYDKNTTDTVGNMPASQTKTYGVNLTLSSNSPTRDGYTFDGWATSSSGAVAYAAGGTYTTNASITLYAKWSQITYTITWNANGGSPNQSSTGNNGATVTAPTQGTGTFQIDRTGYDLLYFRDTPSADYLYSINPGGNWTIDNRSRTFYARWALKTYTVSYNKNTTDTVGSMPSDQTKTYGVNLTLSSNTPTRTGYTFDGWATSSSGAVAYSAGGTYSANAAVTLYAKWSQITYTITWNANGGTPNQSSSGADGATVTAPTQGTGSGQISRTGYTLLYFRDTPSADYLYSINPGGSWTIDGRSRTFYARWSLNSTTPSVPGTPTLTYVSANNTSTTWGYSATWGASTGSGTIIYQLDCIGSSGGTATKGTYSTNSASFNLSRNDNTWQVRVRASNDGGTTWSNYSSYSNSA